MGWWSAGENGESFSGNADMVWGDSVADIIDDAIDSIIAEFEDYWGRKPTVEELKSGIMFALNVYGEEQCS